MTVPSFLQQAGYIDLVTFKRDGTKVGTPVWFAIDSSDRLVVFCDRDSGKMKRIRNSGRVELAPCNYKGKRTGPQVDGTAVELDSAQHAEVHRVLDGKYGWKKRLFQVGVTISEKVRRKGKSPETCIAITLAS
jgi:uncharacterized protein